MMNNISIDSKRSACAYKRLMITVHGVVQGVGFRPFIYRLARELDLKGRAGNTGFGVVVDVEGASDGIEQFLSRLQTEKPANSSIVNLQYVEREPNGYKQFEIGESDQSHSKTAFILPDIATCPECFNDIFSTSNRRYHYPFTNCTHCGPRYSIIKTLPYDRGNTSMARFTMCADCRREYDDPENRRFHAQPNACPVCGPQIELWDQSGNCLHKGNDVIKKAVEALKGGLIVAIKGMGGFHLFADALNEKCVNILRERKQRQRKPFALMFPSMKFIKEQCCVSGKEEELLLSGAAPIVIVPKKATISIAPSVALGNPNLGVLLPYTPLHHILMKEFAGPVVATSGNMSEEPICIDEHEACGRLGDVADLFLVHDRPIVRPVDDSIIRVMVDRPLVLRRARGFAPLPVSTKCAHQGPILAVGAHLKNTVALSIDGHVTVSQHLGDLQSPRSMEVFQETIESLKEVFEPSIEQIACDMHPDYLSTQWAVKSQKHVQRVQHHHAHIVACMAENNLDGTVLGMAWDGSGFGPDKTVWGGEFLKASLNNFQRVGHLKTFMLPGGDKAVGEPNRVAVGVLNELSSDPFLEFADLPSIKTFDRDTQKILGQMLNKKINTPRTSSMGRLFDAAASLLDICQVANFEGEPAMALEHTAQTAQTDDHYQFEIKKNRRSCYEIDWSLSFRELISDIRSGRDTNTMAAKFHNMLVEAAAALAGMVNEQKIVLSGGCFQNKLLSERLIARLKADGFQVYWHQWIPPNDGGIALGQAVCAAARQKH